MLNENAEQDSPAADGLLDPDMGREAQRDNLAKKNTGANKHG